MIFGSSISDGSSAYDVAVRADGQPNILLIVSDQERQRSWIPAHLSLPNRQRLIDEGLEFTNHFTHSVPCSPSRASLFAGQYLPQHGVAENVIAPTHRELDPATPTIGHVLRRAGYRTAYIGKWHLSQSPAPDMEAFGFSDWSGNDRHFMGWAGTGWHFDPIIAAQAAAWLRANGAGDRERPWFLTVALVNPHDVMWFPVDQPDYQAAHAEDLEFIRGILAAAKWKEDEPVPAFTEPYPEVFESLPDNFDDDLFTKPEVQRTWLHEQQHSLYGRIDPGDKGSWLRHLDYYWRLHQAGDENLGMVLDALDVTGKAADTAVVFTSDHGDMCGSHGLRSKGPWVYQENVNVPLYIRVPGVTSAGATTAALSTHVDLAATICAIGGAPLDAHPSLSGVDLTPVLKDTNAKARDSVLFALDSAQYERCIHTRYAIRGIFDGRYKYARYYGVGGSTTQIGRRWPSPKLFDDDAAFEDHDHEWYDLAEDPDELVNLANDRGRRAELREWFGRLKVEEAAAFTSTSNP